MKIKLTPAQLDALQVGDYFPEDGPFPAHVEDRSLVFEDKDAAWRLVVDACNLADDWAAYWRQRQAPELAKHAARDSRALGNLASKVLRS